jgi:capsule polysaccharide export protein KpsE/RkpR
MLSTPTNAVRIEAASIALEAYRDAKGVTDLSRQSDAETLSDLLADLRHFAAVEEIDFEAAIRLSEFHYEAESR